MAGAEFVSLAAMLVHPPDPAPSPPLPGREPEPEPEPATSAAAPLPAAVADALREVRLFRARLADAFDDALARLLRDIAGEVVGRELLLAPAEIGALVQSRLARMPVVRVRVAPGETCRVAEIPVLADPLLLPGDAILELAGGAFDLRLAVRLADVLAAFA